MDLYSYSTFRVLMTTQSSLQYSFTFTQSHTHSYSASIAALCCSMRHNWGFSILLKDTSACRFGKTGDRTADLQVGGRPHFIPSATAAHRHPIYPKEYRSPEVSDRRRVTKRVNRRENPSLKKIFIPNLSRD